MYLNQNGKMCCLGVGCEIFNAEKVKTKDHQATMYKDTPLPVSASAPQFLVKTLALADALGEPCEGKQGKCLSVLNDTGITFKEIAQLLRANPEVYFTESR